MESEKVTKAMSGYSILMLFFILVALAVFSGVNQMVVPAILMAVIAFFILPGFSVINPNEGLVITLFGVYKIM